MTKPKSIGVCPICGKTLQLVAKHLREIHRVSNATERAILNNLATGRTVIPPGPVPGCLPHILNLDKHLKGHKDLTQAGVERQRARAKRDVAIAALQRLRASNPQPPMVSRLDMEGEDPGEGSSRSQPQECRSCRDLGKKNRQLEAQVAVLEARVRRYKRKLKALRRPPLSSSSSSEEPRRHRQPQPQPQPTSSSSVEEPTCPQQPQPQPTSSSSAYSSSEEEPTRPQQPQPQPTSSSSSSMSHYCCSLFTQETHSAEAPPKKKAKTKHISSPEEDLLKKL
ncbi:hypothetical protein D5F01_LYC23779 [Larimichthys crocea]|uniref:Uncharacterized protein n=1 Tax=Larimichthys crocea TaxID=215358 RepID=A0A6G0HFX4_LARCR|nr:hypothetical protein D5F01_LYC23779 [Larimichthys crocea]